MGTWGGMVVRMEEHTGSWGHRGPVNGLSIKSVQIPRHRGCWCVCILVDRGTMCLSNSCSVSQMLNDPLSHVQFWFFFKEKFPNLTTGKVAQVAGRVIMAYQKARDTQSQGPQREEAREKQMFTPGVLWRNASRISNFSPKRWVCPWCTQYLLRTYGQWFHHSGTATSTVRMSVKHCFTSSWVFFYFFLVHYSVVGLTSVCMCAGTCVCLHVHLHMEVRDQLWLLFPRNHLYWFFFSFFFFLFSF